MRLSIKEIELHKNTAKILKKSEQRKFKAEITNMYLKWDILASRRVFWWLSKTVELWQNELRTGIECLWFHKNCGRSRLEEKFPNLSKDIEDLVKNDIAADNKLQSTFKFCRTTTKEVRNKLIELKWYKEEDFQIRWLNNTLNRLWYRLKKT